MSAVSQAREFGKYEVLEQIAAGDTSEIFRARLSGIGGFQRHLAIKRIRTHLNGSTEFINELTNEARVAGLLSHANIVQIMDLGQVEGSWFVAMEYVKGPDLRRVLQRCERKGITLPVPHAVFICIELLKGLEYAHNRQIMRGGRMVPLNVVHRNLCPEKILVSGQGEVKLADFVGVSREGHPDYLAPEQARGEATLLSDLYSAGMMLYEMLTGVRPSRPPQPASEINPDIPYQLEVILDRAIQPDPRRRFPSSTALKDALDSFFHDAGFIFSHSTLAAFLRSLFPEGEPTPRLSEQETRPLRRGDLEEDDDADILDIEQSEAEIPGIPISDPDTLVTAPMSVAAMDDLPTRIERPVNLKDHFPVADSSVRYTQPILPDAPEDETLISRAVDVWSDAQTVIQKDPTRPDPPGTPLSETTRPTPASPAGPAPEIPTAPQKAWVDRPPPRQLAGRPDPRAAEQRTPESQERRSSRRRASQRFLILLSALAVVGMVLMLFLGFFLGRSRPVVTDSEVGEVSAAPVTAPSPPRLELTLPEGATLYLDNAPRTETGAVSLTLKPDTLQVLKIELEGYYPVEVELRLRPDEIRVLSFEQVPLQPRRR